MDKLAENLSKQLQLQVNPWDQYRGLSFKAFWNKIGPPQQKPELPVQIFDYEIELLEILEKREHKQIWIKKARGLGITEFMLRYMAWLCLRNNKLKGSQMAIITGPRLDLAIDLIDRLKGFFGGKEQFEEDKTVITLNGVKIKGYPSNANTSRGQPNMVFILLDEADYFDPNDQKTAREASEGYLAKSNPYIIMVSTPNNPGGLYQTIENEKNSIYQKDRKSVV